MAFPSIEKNNLLDMVIRMLQYNKGSIALFSDE